MPVWPGFNVLQAGSSQLVRLQDVLDLFENLKEREDVRFQMNEPWGDRLLAICREPNTSELSGAEREDLKEEQLRNIARLLVQLIQELACPDQSGRSISSSNTAQIWQENECPMQPKHSVGINVSGEYVKAMFGERIDKSGQRKKLYVLLHRISCWAARGNPSDSTPLATHSCGKKRCLRLDCLQWGNHRSNQRDAYKSARGKRRTRLVSSIMRSFRSRPLFLVGPKAGHVFRYQYLALLEPLGFFRTHLVT